MNQQELNERIAVEVMNFQFSTPPGMVSNKWRRKLPSGYVDVCFDGLPNYSGYMQYAWLVVEELQSRDVVLECLSYLRRSWYCNFKQDTPRVWGMVRGQRTPAIAICLAALEIIAKLRKE